MIKILEYQEPKILKEIYIVSKNSVGQNIVIGLILYLRKVKEDYLLKNDPEKNNFIRLLNYPKQELFPHDIIDDSILNAIRDQFPDSFVKSDQIMYKSDLNKIKIITQVPNQIANLSLKVNSIGVDLSDMNKSQQNYFIKNVNIYQRFTAESIKGKHFTGTYDFRIQSQIESYKNLNEIEFL